MVDVGVDAGGEAEFKYCLILWHNLNKKETHGQNKLWAHLCLTKPDLTKAVTAWFWDTIVKFKCRALLSVNITGTFIKAPDIKHAQIYFLFTHQDCKTSPETI